MTTLDTSSRETLKALQEQLTLRLTQFRARVRTRLVIAGAAVWLAETAGVLILTFLLDHTLRLGLPARLAMLIACLAGLGCEAWRRIIQPLRLQLGLVALAGTLDRSTGNGNQELAARVASILELPPLLEARDPPSPAMVERAVRRGHESLSAVDFTASLDPARPRQMAGIIAAALLIPALLIAIFPANAGLWARRLFLASAEPWPQYTYLEVADLSNNRIAVPRGEPYVLRAHARHGSITPDRISLNIQSAGKTTILMKEFGKNDFRHDFAVVDQPLQLELEGGDDDLGPITLQPVDRPRITALELASQHPRQTAPEIHNFSGGDSDLNFLVKTRLALAVTSNVPLRELRLKPATSLPQPANVRQIDPTHFTIEWIHEGPARFDLELVAAETGLVSVPSPVSIGLKIDQPPSVTMSYTGVHPRITPQATIPLTIEARDDYGVKDANLAIRSETPDPADPAKLIPHDVTSSLSYGLGASTPATPTATNPALIATVADFQIKDPLDIASMKLPPGALVTITADATDDCYTGPQTAHSRPITFRLVPPEELFREILVRQQGERIKFRKEIEEAEKIRDAIRIVASAPQAAELSRRHRAFQRETQRIAITMTESLTEIRLNALGSPESIALMEHNILAPMNALQTELVGPQMQALDTLFPAAGSPPDAAAIQSAAGREDQIIARMNIILKQMAQWDSFIDVLNQLDEIIKLETQVRDQSEKLRQKEAEGVFEK